MAERHKKTGWPWIRWVALGLTCVGVVVASYDIGRYLALTHMDKGAELQTISTPTPPKALPPSKQPPARVTISQKKPAEQTPPKPDKETKIGTKPAPENETYVIQVGSFTAQKHAQEIAQSLVDKGYSIQVVESATGGGARYSVCIEAGHNKEAAEKLLSRLKKKYPDAFLKSLQAAKGRN
jgi:cell division protein FtsN